MGATTQDVLRLVAGGAVRVIVTGAVIGLLASAALTRLLTAMLFGVQPLDPITFLWVAIVLAATAAVAVAGPAWRAAHIDPAVTLRSS
jgi:putative ABC transport system permease protein